MSLSSSTSTGSQIATWRRSLTWTRREFSFDLQSLLTGKIFVWLPTFLSLKPVQRDTLPHRQSQLSDLTIRLRRLLWSLYHRNGDFITKYSNGRFDQFNFLNVNQSMSRDQSFFVFIGQIAFSWYSVMINHSMLMFRHQLLIRSKINNGWSMAVTVLQRKQASKHLYLPN